ncbi:hypothetical protein H0H92_012629 [Tricholoma furcatifolium]|nr:hypothetical protein H0H92_011358 [Tricholoma furcatifolium]KAG6827248.1 hypothetical protein H0H92_012629 [Tricholoma furcatifolium]
MPVTSTHAPHSNSHLSTSPSVTDTSLLASRSAIQMDSDYGYNAPKQAALQIDFLIVGGGISGLACAIALRRVGHRVVLLEADRTLDTQYSGGCRMAPNCAKVLYNWGLRDSLAPIAIKSEAIDLVKFHTGEVLGSHVWDEEMLRETRGEFLVAHYADFRKLLYETAVSFGADVRLGTRVAAIDPAKEPAGEATVTLESGEVLKADVVIGADGATGLIRTSILDGSPTPRQVHFVMYSTVISKKAIMSDPLLRGLYDREHVSMYSWFGTGCSAIAYPLGGEEDFALTVYGPPDGFDGPWTQPSVVDGLRALLESAEPRLQRLGSMATQVTCVPVAEFEALDDWFEPTSGSVLAVGEAASPFPAGAIQTCAMAIEDGAILAKIFSHLRTSDQIYSFVDAFQTVREPRRTKVCTKEFADIYFMTMGPSPEVEGRDNHFRGRRDRGLNVLDAESFEDETPQWVEIKEVFGYDAEDAADDWWQGWGVLRERSLGRRPVPPKGGFGTKIVVVQVGA